MLLALLGGAGLRIGEALALRWSHVDLATGTLHVVDAKTAAGVRSVDLTPALRHQLVLWRAESRFTAPGDYVLTTSTGRKHSPSNLRRDVLRTAVEAANAELAKDGIAEIDGILPLAQTDVREPPLRERRRRSLHGGADRARGPALHTEGVRAGDEAP